MTKTAKPQNISKKTWDRLPTHGFRKLARAILKPALCSIRAMSIKWRSYGKVKYFCIGRNKTGTTSLKHAFADLGFDVGEQRKAEKLTAKYYLEGNFKPIIDYCKSAQVFQDAPFSYPNTFKLLDEAYPNSKFILTVRDDAEQWYRSLTRFHAKKFGRDGRIPTVEDLKAAKYVWPGFIYNSVKIHGATDDDPYNKKILTAHYDKHNSDVIEYFKNRPDDLLVINISQSGEYQKFVEFLGIDSPYEDFPWENRT